MELVDNDAADDAADEILQPIILRRENQDSQRPEEAGGLEQPFEFPQVEKHQARDYPEDQQCDKFQVARSVGFHINGSALDLPLATVFFEDDRVGELPDKIRQQYEQPGVADVGARLELEGHG